MWRGGRRPLLLNKGPVSEYGQQSTVSWSKLLKTHRLIVLLQTVTAYGTVALYVDHSIDTWRPKRALKSEF